MAVTVTPDTDPAPEITRPTILGCCPHALRDDVVDVKAIVEISTARRGGEVQSSANHQVRSKNSPS